LVFVSEADIPTLVKAFPFENPTVIIRPDIRIGLGIHNVSRKGRMMGIWQLGVSGVSLQHEHSEN